MGRVERPRLETITIVELNGKSSDLTMDLSFKLKHSGVQPLAVSSIFSLLLACVQAVYTGTIFYLVTLKQNMVKCCLTKQV